MNRCLKILVVGMVMVLLTAGCGAKTETPGDANSEGDKSTVEERVDETSEKAEITVAYQSSVGYAPLIVMKEKKLIEESFDGEISVNWVEMNNGAEINEGLISGKIDVGTMGVPVAIIGIQAGSPYRIAFGLSAQPYSVLTSSDDINSIQDISEKDQIAIVNLNSQPHILLAMAAKAELGDAHALDKNLTILKNADGYEAMLSGAVNCHMVISPYNFMELSNSEANIHEIPISSEIWNPQNTTLVGVVTEDLKNNKPKVYDAFLKAFDNATKFIAENPSDTAELLASGYDASAEEIEKWITDPRSSYDSTLHGVMEMANFMVEEGFLEEGPSSINDLIYDGVKGD